MQRRDVIKSLLKTEKGYTQEPQGKYLFLVAKDANKTEIQKAIEGRFNVTVLKVNTMVMKGKPRRVRQALGKTSSWKKAIVTIEQGQTIEIGS